MINWTAIDHFTGLPFKRINGTWQVKDYVCDFAKITQLPNGDRELEVRGKIIGVFNTVKKAKEIAEQYK